jgi:hypothetical protein
MIILTEMPQMHEINGTAFTLVFQTDHAVQCRQLSWDGPQLTIFNPRGSIWDNIAIEGLHRYTLNNQHCFMVHPTSLRT